jgi:hypothetical protein
MCYTVFIATPTPQPTTEFVDGVSKLCLSVPDAGELERLAGKFTLPYVYHVGADGGCSCGFSFQSQFYDDPKWPDSKASPQALLDLLNELTTHTTVEYYCCWSGNEDGPIENRRRLNSREISLKENYFELEEDEFIWFIAEKIERI